MSRGKGFLLTGYCSHPKCKLRSILAEKLPLAGNTWWERCEEHARDQIVLSAETMHKLGREMDFTKVTPASRGPQLLNS